VHIDQYFVLLRRRFRALDKSASEFLKYDVAGDLVASPAVRKGLCELPRAVRGLTEKGTHILMSRKWGSWEERGGYGEGAGRVWRIGRVSLKSLGSLQVLGEQGGETREKREETGNGDDLSVLKVRRTSPLPCTTVRVWQGRRFPEAIFCDAERAFPHFPKKPPETIVRVR
jgi:hypothetical protein